MNFMVILILEWVFFSLSSEAPGPDGAVNVGYGQTPETVPESTPVNLVPKELNAPGGLTEEIKTSQKAIAPDASHDSTPVAQNGASRLFVESICFSTYCKADG